ncbi:MAG TPA: hypothetical protein VFA81_00280 [Burkholderiales bacterium]|nr:hypothetical protein [Burkholderiales bacterium]
MRALTILTLLLVAIDMGLVLAHALELPGKLRLNEAAYKATQTIYYPGFTFGGLVGELGGMIALAVLLYLTPFATSRFWWTAAALVLLLASHATYWLMTHPVNNFWVKDVTASGLGAKFFSTFAATQARDWTQLRNVWELSQVVRAAFAVLSLISIAVAATLA